MSQIKIEGRPSGWGIWARIGRWVAGLFLLAGCTLADIPETLPTETTPPTSTSGWEVIAPGLERRTYVVDSNSPAQILALRIDPAQYRARVHYRPGEPLRVQEWVESLPGVVALVNGNFFDPERNVVGLLVSDGVVYGQSFQGRGGMFAVQNGVPRVRSNSLEPYRGEALEQAVQAFPMLVLDGEQAYHSTAPDRVTRRTAIGQDTQGRIILMTTPLIGMTLIELSAFLPTTDMQLVNAFNLDGGGSTMMYITTESQPYLLASIDPVPAVLAFYGR